MSAGSGWVEGLYGRALRLYPAEFQESYAEPMRQAVRDALADGAARRPRFLLVLVRDLITSLIKEHMAMVREGYARSAIVFNALVLAGISTVLGIALWVIPTQVLRSGANDPQVEMATNLGARLDSVGLTAGLQDALHSDGTVDMERSLSPFLIVYNDQGQALGSTGQLHGQTPVLPAGILSFVRAHGEERVSWRPERGVRIAAVVERVNGQEPGFVLAGRNLREVQARMTMVEQTAGMAWLGMLGLIAVGSLAFGWMTRRKAVAV